MDIEKELNRRFLLQEEYLGTQKPVNLTQPLVTVRVATYQHGSYIRECLDSLVGQVTRFPYEIIVGEDGSTDGTREICIEYAERYPDKIRLFLRDRELSQYYVDGKFVCRFNSRWISLSSRGKYIAICEGDDYWNDMHKLQKQVDILEADPEIGITHGDCDQLHEDGSIVHAINRGLTTSYKGDRDLLFDLLISGKYKVRTASVMYRADVVKSLHSEILQIQGKFLMGDTPLWLLLSRITKFHYIDEVLAVYRISRNSLSRPGTREKQLRFRLSMVEMRIYYLEKFGKAIGKPMQERYNNTLLLYKAYNPSYKEQHPLFSPSPIQAFLYKNIQKKLVRKIIKFNSKISALKSRLGL